MDFVKIGYTASVKEGRVFDTTDAETARKEKIFDSKRVYKPLPVIVGEGQVVKGLDEALKGMNPGEERTLELSPEKAFGARDSALIRLVPIKFFKQQGINPIPGMPVELDGRMARIQTVAGGRVRVDFNHDLAGKTVTYKVEVVSKAGSNDDKIRFLIERSFNESDGFKVNLSDKKLTVELPETAARDRNIVVRKASLSAELFKYLELSEVTYTENWKNPKAEKNKEEKQKE
ncbi:MAG: FKBP-type peptidyl-prolyl cis-trans isomerase [Candidatus Altiarchaeota archaeon]